MDVDTESEGEEPEASEGVGTQQGDTVVRGAVTAYQYYYRLESTKIRQQMMQEGFAGSLQEVQQAVSVRWRSLPNAEREPYEDIARVDRERHLRECAQRDEEVLRRQAERRAQNSVGDDVGSRMRTSTVAATQIVYRELDVPKRKRVFTEEEREEREARRKVGAQLTKTPPNTYCAYYILTLMHSSAPPYRSTPRPSRSKRTSSNKRRASSKTPRRSRRRLGSSTFWSRATFSRTLARPPAASRARKPPRSPSSLPRRAPVAAAAAAAVNPAAAASRPRRRRTSTAMTHSTRAPS